MQNEELKSDQFPDGKPTRFIGNQTDRFADYIEAAKNYVAGLRPGEAEWLYSKPFEVQTGHSYYFRSQYSALNIISAMGLQSGARILEIGAGPGWLTEILAMLGYRVDAIEPASDLVYIARSRIAALKDHHRCDASDRVRFFEKPVEELELPESSYDGVIFYDVLHHVVDEHRTLSVCFDLLKPGGVVGIVEGAWHPSFKELESSLLEEMQRCGTLENPFSTEYLDFLLEKTGFRAVTRFISVNGYFPAAAIDAPFSNFISSHPTHSNDLTARKPLSDGSPEWAGQIHADVSRRNGDTQVLVKLSNTGCREWRPGSSWGSVTVAIYVDKSSGDVKGPYVDITQRSTLPFVVPPGGYAEVSMTLPPDKSIVDASVGLVCEQQFFLSEKGIEPFILDDFGNS